MEVLSVDDNSREQILPLSSAMIVNRFTPARAPFNVESVRVQLPPLGDGSSPAGRPLRIVIFADAARAGQPPANPQLLVDRTITIPNLPENRLLEVMLPAPLTVNGGDLYVGVQSPNANVAFAADGSSAARNRSFISTNNGGSFQPLQVAVNGNNAPANVILRAVVNAKFNAVNNRPPEIAAISPTAAPSGSSFKLRVYGQSFFPDSDDAAGVRYKSAIRWNGQEKPTEFLAHSQLQAEITAADLAGLSTARVTVFTATPNGGFESAPVEFGVTANAPTPVVTRLEPAVAAVASSATTLTIHGRNFTPNSVAQWNGGNRTTKFISSVKLEATLPANDLAAAANAEIKVFTPTPGGGSSNVETFRVAPCSYRLSETNQTVGGARQFDENSELNLKGVMLETESHCQWTAQSDANWIVLADRSGVGRAPIGYNILNNSGAAPRAGAITVANQTLTINQVGAPPVVSSASYGTGNAPDSVATIFGVGLAKTTQAATTQPLPTNLEGTTVTVTRIGLGRQPLNAGLFFASPTQINFLMPVDSTPPPLPQAGLPAFVSVFIDGKLVADSFIFLAPVTPGLFSADASGKGIAAAVALRVKADGSQQFEPVGVFDQMQNRFIALPIDLGPQTDRVFLLLFGTGIRGRSSLLSTEVRVGGIVTPALFAGAQGDFAGLDQVNVELPRALIGRGEVPV
ncbi:MAG: IPT/TIG domain-containing protein, partial [Blastocatellia bacterium]